MLWLILAPVLIPQAWASLETCEALLERSWSCKESYGAGACNENIHKLVKALKSEGVDLHEASVLYLLPERGPQSPDFSPVLPTVNSRNPDVSWVFHVILVHDGRVLDLDYTQTPRIEAIDQYFTTMFGLEVQSWAREVTWIREIPALEYLYEYRKRDEELGLWRDAQYYWLYAEDRYPAVTLEQFLRKQSES